MLFPTELDTFPAVSVYAYTSPAPGKDIARLPQGQEDGDDCGDKAPDDGEDNEEGEVALAEDACRDGQHRPDDAEDDGQDAGCYPRVLRSTHAPNCQLRQMASCSQMKLLGHPGESFSLLENAP